VPSGSLDSTTSARVVVRAPRGSSLTCKGWQQEAALRMLMNALDPDVAEQPEELIACGTAGKAARDWSSYAAIVKALRTLENDETLFVQAGAAAGVRRTSADAPRVAIDAASSAANWMYVGTQGALEETYETFRAAAKKLFGSDLAGRLVVSAGMGGLGGAQPLAAQLNGAALLGIDADPARTKRRVKGGYCDVMVNSLDEGLRILKNAVRQRAARSVGLVGNAADVLTELAQRGVVPDLLTDQTSAHDPLRGYWPRGLSLAEAGELRRSDPAEALRRSRDSIAAQVRAMFALRKLGSVVFDFGSEIFARAREAGVEGTDSIPNFAEAYLAGALGEDRALLRWVALSGEPADIQRIDRLALEFGAGDEMLARWIPLAQKNVRFQGLPARVCYFPRRELARFGAAVNDLVARGELNAPIVLGRDFLDCDANGAGDEGPGTGIGLDSTKVAAAVEAASGASWAALRGRGVALLADGTPEAGARIGRAMAK